MAKFQPFSIVDRAAFIRRAHVAVGIVQVPTFETIAYNIAYDRVEVVRIPEAEMALPGGQYSIDNPATQGGNAVQAQNHLAWLRTTALRSGATPDAIRLLGAIKPFTKKEEAEMAEKLKTKKAAAPKSADKEALKSAAKAAPVAGDKATPKRGNAEALAKARAARSTGPDTRKVKGLVKVKELTAREGSKRRTMLEDLLAAKTVQEFRDKGHSAGDLKYAVDAGIVSVG